MTAHLSLSLSLGTLFRYLFQALAPCSPNGLHPLQQLPAQVPLSLSYFSHRPPLSRQLSQDRHQACLSHTGLRICQSGPDIAEMGRGFVE